MMQEEMFEMKSVEGSTNFSVKFHKAIGKPYKQSIVIRNRH